MCSTFVPRGQWPACAPWCARRDGRGPHRRLRRQRGRPRPRSPARRVCATRARGGRVGLSSGARAPGGFPFAPSLPHPCFVRGHASAGFPSLRILLRSRAHPRFCIFGEVRNEGHNGGRHAHVQWREGGRRQVRKTGGHSPRKGPQPPWANCLWQCRTQGIEALFCVFTRSIGLCANAGILL